MIAPGFKRLLVGPDRKLRMLWRAAMFFALAYWVLPLALDPAFAFVADRLHLAAGLTAANVAINEFENFIVALICTAIFARYEGPRVRRTHRRGRARRHRHGRRGGGGHVSPGRHAHSWARDRRKRARAVGARLARCEPVRRRGGGILVPLLFPAGAVEKPGLLAGVDRHRAHLRG